jgi:cbb3-type cytochrome oxidase subunit 3
MFTFCIFLTYTWLLIALVIVQCSVIDFESSRRERNSVGREDTVLSLSDDAETSRNKFENKSASGN